jgi:hypothetical protein
MGGGTHERFAEIAAEFVRLKVAVIVTWGTATTIAAKQATSLIEPLGFGIFPGPAVFGAFGQVLIIGSEIEHLFFRDGIGHVLRQSARFLRTVAPVLWII